MADAGKARLLAKAAEVQAPAQRESGTPSNQAHLRYRPDIDGLRAVAILPVVFYHFALGCPGGFVGVDVFFVISGFLITKIIYTLVVEGKFSFVEFYDRRVRRLFPALFVMLFAVALWSMIYLVAPDLRSFGASLAAATSYVSNLYFHFATTGYFHQDSSTMPLLHTWSLAVEEQFYILAPFALFALAWGTPRRWHVPAIAAVTIASFVLCAWMTRDHPEPAFYLLPTRAWELGLGAFLAIGAVEIRHRWGRELLSLAGLSSIFFAIFGFSDGTPFPGWHAAIPTLGTAAILSAGRSGSIVTRVLATEPFTFVGKISYSLYLWHWPVILAFTYGALGAATLSKSLLCILISFVFAVLSWWYVERPFRERRLLPDATSLFRGAGFASAAAIGVGLLLYFSNGLPQRHGPRITALLEHARTPPPRPECSEVTPGRAAADRLCIRGAPGVRPSFVLVGDSHANSLSAGLFRAARARGVAGVQFTHIGFVPLLGRYLSDGKPSDPLAPVFAAYLRRHAELRTVIMTGFWTDEVIGKSYRYPLQTYVDEDYDGSGAAYNPIAFRHALDRLVAAFPDRRFILLDDTPSGDALSPLVHARILRSGGSRPPQGLPRTTADAERASYEPIFRSVAEMHRNIVYVPVLARLCGTRICPLFRRDGIPLYRDGDHLSRAASESLAPALEVLFGARTREVPRFEAPPRREPKAASRRV